MRLGSPARIKKWPFLVGDLCLLSLAFAIGRFSPNPFAPLSLILLVTCVAAGAFLAAAPFLIDFLENQRDEERQDREAFEANINRLHATAELLIRSAAQLKTLEEISAKTLQSAETLPYRIQEKLATLQEQAAQQEDEEKEALKQELQQLREAQAEKLLKVTDQVTRSVEALKKIERNWQHPVARPTEETAPREKNSPPAPSSAVDEVAPSLAPVSPAPAPAVARKKQPSRAKHDELTLEIPLEPSAAPAPDSASARTRLHATAYIGIGNKLFLRGEGAGLSWDQGIPLHFDSIGKWSWEPAAVAEKIICRIYKNDQLPDQNGDLELAPGDVREITPRFE